MEEWDGDDGREEGREREDTADEAELTRDKRGKCVSERDVFFNDLPYNLSQHKPIVGWPSK